MNDDAQRIRTCAGNMLCAYFLLVAIGLGWAVIAGVQPPWLESAVVSLLLLNLRLLCSWCVIVRQHQRAIKTGRSGIPPQAQRRAARYKSFGQIRTLPTASPWTAGGKIYCLDEVGLTSVLESGPKFKLLASNRLDENIFWASAAFAGDRLILRSMENLYCIGGQSR